VGWSMMVGEIVVDITLQLKVKEEGGEGK